MASLHHRHRYSQLPFLLSNILLLLLLLNLPILTLPQPLAVDETPPLYTTLSNHKEFPLLGLGAGNIEPSKIPLIISQSLSPILNIRLIDTSHKSGNEALIARALSRGMKQYAKTNPFDDESTHVIHILTKVWYTHLGYERTYLSVQESLNDLSTIISSPPKNWSVKVHVLLQYARCNDELEFTRCDEEESELNDSTRSIGLNPLENKENAWKDSWRALEELYNAGLVESIGVSNFRVEDMRELLDMCRVKPQIYQGSLQSLMYDKELVRLVQSNNIHFQAYNTVGEVYTRKVDAPKAFKVLERISAGYLDEDLGGFSVSRLLLAWLTQRGVGVVIGTTNQDHLVDNSPAQVLKFPPLKSTHDRDVETAVVAILAEFNYSGTDPNKGVVTTFLNALSKTVKVFLMNNKGYQIPITTYMAPGKSSRIIANPRDVFVVYDGHGAVVKRFRVMAEDGGEESFYIEL